MPVSMKLVKEAKWLSLSLIAFVIQSNSGILARDVLGLSVEV
jgi:hypothetical protein